MISGIKFHQDFNLQDAIQGDGKGQDQITVVISVLTLSLAGLTVTGVLAKTVTCDGKLTQSVSLPLQINISISDNSFQYFNHKI